VFAAADVAAREDGRDPITRRARRWRFSHKSAQDHAEHAAVRAAAGFLGEHASCLPAHAAPSNPTRLAVLAIKAYEVFLEPRQPSADEPLAPVEVAKAAVAAVVAVIVAAEEGFEALAAKRQP
jgi:hypothetical protein